MSASAQPAPRRRLRGGPPPPHGVAKKGLRANAIGFAGSTVLGVVQTAPAYWLAVTMGFLAAAVALQGPAILVLSFIPIHCMTIVEQEFVRASRTAARCSCGSGAPSDRARAGYAL